MTILKGDIKLVKSQVMDDVPEGGNGPTANEVVDGDSNEIFSDISESDRAAGRVSARKVHVWIQSHDTDTFLGGNVIIAEPPNDPNVSVTLMSTGDVFDIRSAAISRIEAYLNVGATYQGYLYGNHIAGQAVLAIIQRTSDLPAVGATLALTKYEGLSNQQIQYVRVTEASSRKQTFTDMQGDFERYVLTLKLSDPLRYDFPGFDASRIDPTRAQLIAATKVSDVVVTDAAKYAGTAELDDVAAIGDFGVKAKSIFTQLVPSAQVETPIVDARTNQTRVGVLSSGRMVSRTITAYAGPNKPFYVGGAIVPGSFSMQPFGVLCTDDQGYLVSASSRIGTVDYANGIVVWSTGGDDLYTFPIAYMLGAAAEVPTQSLGLTVTLENRAINFVRTLPSKPAKGTMTFSFRAQGRWYVLADYGDGNLRGTDSSYGAGQINFTTDTVNVTMGALPDVGSAVIVDYVEAEASRPADTTQLLVEGRMYLPFNSDGEITEEPGSKAFQPGQMSIAWTQGTARTATDNGAGVISGGGMTGTVNYAKGTARVWFANVPEKGTLLNVTTKQVTPVQAAISMVGGSGSLGVTNVTPGSVELVLQGRLRFTYLGGPVTDYAVRTFRVSDDGAGNLLAAVADGFVAVGTVNYTAGTFAFASSTSIPTVLVLGLIAWDNAYKLVNNPSWSFEAA